MSVLRPALKILRSVEVGPRYLLIPIFLSLAAAAFEGIGTGLLVPLLRGLVEKDFSFLSDSSWGKIILDHAPWVFNQGHLQTFSLFLVLVFVASLSRITLSYLSDVSYAFRLRQLAHEVRCLLFERLLSYGKLYFDRNKQGELHNVVLGFTRQVMYHVRTLHGQLKWLFMLVAYVVLMLVISWKLTIFIALIFPIFHFSLNKIIKKIGDVSREYAKADSEVSNVFYNVIFLHQFS